MKLNYSETLDRQKNGYYLSEATREVDFEYGKFNHINAPVGSGKTTYAAVRLLDDLEETYGGGGRLTIILTPYVMLREQVVAEGLFDKATRSHEVSMSGFIIFDDKYSIQELRELETGKIAMTPHKFFHMLEEERKVFNTSHIMKSIDTLIIDESDHIFHRLPIWERQDNLKQERTEEDEITTFKNAAAVIMEHLYDVMVVSISATGNESLKNIFGSFYNEITFKEELRQYRPQSDSYYSNIHIALDEAMDYGGKIAIFTESVRNMNKQREYFESLGYRVDMIVSDYAKNYSMTARERMIKNELAKTGRSDKIGDILLFNASMERGVSINDKSFHSIIVHSSVADIQTQVIGRFRFNGMRIWRLLSEKDGRVRTDRVALAIDKDTGKISNNIIIPLDYLEVPLTTDMKNELIEEIGFSRKWTSLKEALIKDGYEVGDKRMNIEGKRVRVSIITK